MTVNQEADNGHSTVMHNEFEPTSALLAVALYLSSPALPIPIQ